MHPVFANETRAARRYSGVGRISDISTVAYSVARDTDGRYNGAWTSAKKRNSSRLLARVRANELNTRTVGRGIAKRHYPSIRCVKTGRHWDASVYRRIDAGRQCDINTESTEERYILSRDQSGQDPQDLGLSNWIAKFSGRLICVFATVKFPARSERTESARSWILK